ncbi:FAD-dependent oxidoreductase [Loktanella sp. D2R18]|uniref:NAD(P)/FAD-dependent oxidoreductase n=1 Tax=Rhodobacterales TaxID=204455 RepID=UPI000DEBD52F|nr:MULTISPECIES: FAD-binding oxidoreductase [Rhodobacterales]MDO6591687.1 FAD-binding oxidoreductase [Yoonia sp. 1_MG-2023]RBW42565.1 FAD-dependent oxidoreductase [Loktanella sp. D2R18]
MNPLYRNDKPGQFPPSWYAASADTPAARPSLDTDMTVDVCVIGAGFTGLSAARDLAARGFDVVVLDAHRVGFGASGRNGGQVGSGYNWDQRTLAKSLGNETATGLWTLAEEAKQDIRDICAAHIPEARFRPGVAHGFYSAKEAAHYIRDTEYLSENYGYDQISVVGEADMRELVKSPLYHGGILDMGAGHMHPLRYVIGLARLAEEAGARIFELTEVTKITQGAPVRLCTPNGTVTARHVVIAGNGYLPNIDRKTAAKVMPINSFICATEPLGDRAATVLARDIAVADSKFVVNYYRMSEDNRFLFGGRESYGIGFPTDINTALIQRMTTLFPQLNGVKIDYSWGGTLGITMTRLPAVQRVAPNIVSGAGFSGHGVALSGLAGKIMAEAIAGQAARFDTLSALKVPNFPGGPTFRAPLLTLAMTWYALRDRLGV